MPVTITPRCPHCSGRLYSVRANKPGIGSSEDSVLPYGYCWECQELFRVTIELERVKVREAGQRQQGHTRPLSKQDSSTNLGAGSQFVHQRPSTLIHRVSLDETGS